jgi:hypothetical protein
MANALTGDFDVVAEVSVSAVNRILAAQHQVTTPREIYLHSFQTNIPPGGSADDTGVRGIAEVQVSTPTITLPATGSSSRVSIHFQVMARMRPYPESVDVPEFIHGEIRVTVDVAQILSDTENVIAINLSAADVEVSFVPNSEAPPLTPEQRNLVNQIIDNFMRTGFEPLNLE